MPIAQVQGLLAIIKNQVNNLKVHIQVMSATRSKVRMWQQEQQRLRGLVNTELLLLCTTLAEKDATKTREKNMLEQISNLDMVDLAKLMSCPTHHHLVSQHSQHHGVGWLLPR